MTTCTCDTHTSTTWMDALTCNNTSGSGRALLATANNNGATIQATSSGTAWNSNGVYASTSSTTAACIWGEGGSIGVHGKCYNSGGKGVFAEHAGAGYGLYAISSTSTSAYIGSPSNSSTSLVVDANNGGRAIVATSTGTTGNNSGILSSNNNTGAAIYGSNMSTSTSTPGTGVWGESYNGIGVQGNAYSLNTPAGSPAGSGVYGNGPWIGIKAVTFCGGYSPGLEVNRFGYGIWASTNCPASHNNYGVGIYSDGGSGTSTGYAGYFSGTLYASYISKSGGGFTIDHPLDPENKFLNHGFVEAPEMSNLYKGEVVLDSNGEAVVDLPDYFSAVNKEAVVSLTSRSGPMPNLWAEGDPCVGGKFAIKNGTSGGKVSWIVMSVRNDPFATKYGLPTNKDKGLHEKGLLLHPELFGHGEDKKLSPEKWKDNMAKNHGSAGN